MGIRLPLNNDRDDYNDEHVRAYNIEMFAFILRVRRIPLGGHDFTYYRYTVNMTIDIFTFDL